MSELISHDQVLINAAAARNETSIPEGSISVTASGPNTDNSKPGEYSATLSGNGIDASGSVVVTFDRLNVGDVIAAANIDRIAVRAVQLTGEDVAALIRQHLGINIKADDLTAQQFGPFETRTTINVDVKSDSLLYRGALQVVVDQPRPGDTEGALVLVNTAREPLVSEETLTPAPQQAGQALSIALEVKENGTMAHGSGNRNGEFMQVTNGELSLSLATRIWKKAAPDPINAEAGGYVHQLTANQDWNVPFSFCLTDTAPADAKLTDLYDLEFVWAYVNTGETIKWTLEENAEGGFDLHDGNGMRIIDSNVLGAGRGLQNIQRMSHYVQNQNGNRYFTPEAATDIGGILGDFIFTVTAYRKNSLAAPLVLEVTHNAFVPQPE